MKTINVFLSSPSDVLVERNVAERVIARIGAIWSEQITPRCVRWERNYLGAGRSFQEYFTEMQRYDVVIGVVWKRLGSPLSHTLFHRGDGSPFESGTAFEIEMALNAADEAGSPEVFLFRKTALVAFDEGHLDDDYGQYKSLQAWWQRLVTFPDGTNRRAFRRFKEPEDFEDDLERLFEDYLRRKGYVSDKPRWNTSLLGSPYPGLLPYDFTTAAVFFGRRLATQEAIEQLLNCEGQGSLPALFVVGRSGAGKSSLARAGIVPEVIADRRFPVDNWVHASLEQCESPIRMLAQRLYGASGISTIGRSPATDAGQFANLLRRDPDGAAQVVAWSLKESARECGAEGGIPRARPRLLLLLDQLESMFDSPEIDRLIQFIRPLLEDRVATLIATVRSDSYPTLQDNNGLLEIRKRGVLFDLPAPGPFEINEIIKAPARAAGLSFETQNEASLSKELADAARTGDALPLLQMTLARLFEQRDGAMLTLASYRAMGGLEGAIAAHAEEVFLRTSLYGQRELTTLLRLLVDDISSNGELKLKTVADAALDTNSALRELVEAFIDARLLVRSENDIRVAHEALLRRWDRAANSPVLNPETIRLRRIIEPFHSAWERSHERRDLLPVGAILSGAEQTRVENPAAFPPQIANFIEASASAARRDSEAALHRARRGLAIATLVCSALLGMSVAIFAFYQRSNANLTLALITKANQFVEQQKPTRAQVVAQAVAESDAAGWLASLLHVTASTDDQLVLATLRSITEPSSSAPGRTVSFDHPVTSMDSDVDGSRLVLGFDDGDVLVYQPATDTTKHLPGQTTEVDFVWLLHDHVVSVTRDRIVMWNIKTGSMTDIDAVGGITAAAASVGGETIVWGDTSGIVRTYDIATGKTGEYRTHSKEVTAAAFNGADAFATASEDQTVVVRNLAGVVVARFSTDYSDIWSLAFAATDTTLLTLSVRGPVDAWGIADPEHIQHRTVPVSPGRKWRLKAAPDGQTFAVTSWDGAVDLFYSTTLLSIGVLDGHDARVSDVAFGSGSTLFTADISGRVRSWNLTRLHPTFYDHKISEGEIIVGKYSPDGRHFIGGGEDGVARLFAVDARDGHLEQKCQRANADWIIGAAFSPDSSHVLTVRTAEEIPIRDAVVRWISVADCSSDSTMSSVVGSYVHAVAISPSGSYALLGGEHGRLFRLALSGEAALTEVRSPHAAEISEIDFAPSGRQFASGDESGHVFLWDSDSYKSTELPGPTSFVNTVRFSPDGRRVAAGGYDSFIEVWDVERKSRAARLSIPGGTNRLAFNGDGTLLAAGSDDLYIAQWDTSSWRRNLVLRAGVGVRSVYGYHPTRGDLAFDGGDGTVRVLPRMRSTEPYKGPGQLNGIDVAFSAKGAEVHVATSAQTSARRSDPSRTHMSSAAMRIDADHSNSQNAGRD